MLYFQKLSLLAYLSIVSISDCKNLKIKDTHVAGMCITTVCASFGLSSDVVSCFAVSLVFFIILSAVYLFSAGIGFGDVKLISVISYTMGFFNTCFICIISCGLGLTWFFLCFLRKKKISRIPLAPFITAGTVILYLSEGMK